MPNPFCLISSPSEIVAAKAGGDGPGIWIHLLPAGRFKGRSGRGPWIAGGRKDLEAIVRATRKRSGSTELVIDYDHQSIFGAVPETGGRAPAAGWIKELEVRDDGIWGRVEWTAKAAEAIKAGEYRYISPVFGHNKKTGRIFALVNAGLTNNPDLDLTEVAASAHFTKTETDNDMDEILAALGLAEGSGETEALSAINLLQAECSAFAIAASLDKDAKHEDVLEAVRSAFAAQKGFTVLAENNGAAKGASLDVSIAALSAALKKGGKPDPAKYVPIEQFTALSEEVKELKDGVEEDKVAAAVETAMSEGKIAPASEQWAKDYAKSDLEGFKAFAANAPVVVKPQHGGRKQPGGDGALTESDEVVMSALGIEKEDFVAARKLETET